MTKSLKIAAVVMALGLPTTVSAQDGAAPAEAAPAAPAEAAPADDGRKVNSVNVNPIGALTGDYSVNYNRLLSNGHSVLGEANFSSKSDGSTSSVGGGVRAGYRWYWGGDFDSGFVGFNLGYGAGSAETKVTDSQGQEQKFDLTVGLVSATANIGKRWAWDGGFNITIRAGAGKGIYTVDTDSNDDDAKKAVKDVEELLNGIGIALDGELSAGFCF